MLQVVPVSNDLVGFIVAMLCCPGYKPDNKSYGVAQRNIYASEFGVSSTASFESLSAVLEEPHWGIHGGEAPDKCYGDCQVRTSRLALALIYSNSESNWCGRLD